MVGWPGWRGGLLTNALYWTFFLVLLWRPVNAEDRDTPLLMPLLLGFLGIASLWAAAEFLGFRPLLDNPYLPALQGRFRVTAFPIMNVGYTGWISGVWPLLAPLALLLAGRRRWGWLAAALLLLQCGVAAAQGNLAALVVAGALAAFAALTFRRAPWGAALLLVGALLSPPLTASLNAAGEELQRAGIVSDFASRDEFTGDATGLTTRGRLYLFDSVLRTIAERPLTGWGYETFHNNFYRNLAPQNIEPMVRYLIGAGDDEQVSLDGQTMTATKVVDGRPETRQLTLLMVKPHNYLLEEAYSNGLPALLFVLPLLGLVFWTLWQAHTEQAAYAFWAGLGYGGYLMGWFLNPSVTPLALVLLALGLRSAARQRDNR